MTPPRVYYHDANSTENLLFEGTKNTTDWTRLSHPLRNANTWRIKVVGTLSAEWFGGIGVDDISVSGCHGKYVATPSP